MKLQLKRSNVLDDGQAKVPTPEQMEYGELAVNYNANDPAVFIKSSTDEIIRITGVGSVGGYWTRSGTDLTPYNVGDSLTGVSNADFGGNVTIAGTLTADLTGNADTASYADNAGLLAGYSNSSTNTASTIVRRNSSGDFAAGTITATLNGSATSATSATTATNSTNANFVYVERNDFENATRYVTFVDDNSAGNKRLNMDQDLSYNPSTNTLNCNITGLSTNVVTNVEYANTSGQSDTTKVATNTSAGYKPFVFTTSVPNGTYVELKTDSDATVGIDPSANKIRANTFEGSATQVYSYTWTGTPPSSGFKIAQVVGNAGDNKNVYQRDDVYIGSTGVIFAPGLSVTGGITAVGNISSSSDARLKENIVPIQSALEKVEALEGVTFDYKKGGKSVGLIAQNVETVYPELVGENEDGMKTVAYGNLVGLLIEAIKELKAEIATIKGE